MPASATPDTVQQLVDDVLSEGSFDATPAQALRWLTRRHRTMVAVSRCYRATEDVGPTVAGQRDYPLPGGLVQIYSVEVNGITFGSGWHTDLAQGQAGWLVLSDDGGIVAPEETPAGALELALYPTPTVDGQAVLLRGAFLPPDLLVADDSTLKVPGDFADALVAGAIATALTRLENRADLAAPHEQAFRDGVGELRAQVQRRYRGPGAAQIRVRGLNA